MKTKITLVLLADEAMIVLAALQRTEVPREYPTARRIKEAIRLWRDAQAYNQ